MSPLLANISLNVINTLWTVKNTGEPESEVRAVYQYLANMTYVVSSGSGRGSPLSLPSVRILTDIKLKGVRQ
jgi:hypothetical protein